MKVTERDVTYVAELANLELTDAERARLVSDLSAILDYVDRLNELDTSNVEPMAQFAASAGDNLREDLVGPSLPREEAMRNAPETAGPFFTVPKVIER